MEHKTDSTRTQQDMAQGQLCDLSHRKPDETPTSEEAKKSALVAPVTGTNPDDSFVTTTDLTDFLDLDKVRHFRTHARNRDRPDGAERNIANRGVMQRCLAAHDRDAERFMQALKEVDDKQWNDLPKNTPVPYDREMYRDMMVMTARYHIEGLPQDPDL